MIFPKKHPCLRPASLPVLYPDSVGAVELPYLKVILEAARESGRSERHISMTATGQPSALSMLKSGRIPSVERVRLLCEALALEFYVGPPRVVPPEISRALGLPGHCSVRDALIAIELQRQPPFSTMDSRATGPAESVRADLETYKTETREHLEELKRAITDLELQIPGALENYVSISICSNPDDALRVVTKNEAPFPPLSVSLKRLVLPDWAATGGLLSFVAPDSSMQPTIAGWELVVFDHSQVDPIKDELFVGRVDGRVAIRRLRNLENRWQLQSDNPAHPPVALEDDDLLIGRVAWHGSLRSRKLHWGEGGYSKLLRNAASARLEGLGRGELWTASRDLLLDSAEEPEEQTEEFG